MNRKADNSQAENSQNFIEMQLKNALVSNSVTYFDVNLSQNLIENDFFFKNDENISVSVLEFTDLSAPCSFSDFTQNWARRMILNTSKQNIPHIDNLTEFLINEYKNGNKKFVINYWIDTPYGKKAYLNHTFLLYKNKNDDICAFSVIEDYTKIVTIDEKQKKIQIEQYAYIDPITKGYNYARFKEQLLKYNEEGVIISVDIHSFKVVNSINGITKGDEVIKKIWEVILDQIEVEKKELAAHINADHFIIYLPTFDRQEILQQIKNITYALSFLSSELDVPVLRPYFGIAFWDKTKKIELSYSESIVAKKRARELPDSNYSFFEPKDTKKIFEEKSIIDGFETALAKKDFKIYFQPKYSPTTRRLVGAEALIRWRKNNGTVVPPCDFIPIFEQNGMIRTLDEYVFRNVCQQQKQWLSEGKKIVPVSVNLSRASLYFKNVVNRYLRISDEIGIDRKYVPIEITETAAITNNEIKLIADKFSEAGFSIHMDDFGSGYSSLASLNIMHIETLKIDKSLIDFIGDFGGNRLIEHTITLAKELGISVTAEGVENEEQVDFLHDVGCDSIQGFYFSKPVPFLDFEKLLDSDTSLKEKSHENNIIKHISQFKGTFLKRPIYSFVVNLTQDILYEEIARYNWHNDIDFEGNSYTELTEKITSDFVLPEYKEKYSKIMSRENLVLSFSDAAETQLFEYKQKYANKNVLFRIMIHLFKVPDSSDLWMYFNVTDITETE